MENLETTQVLTSKILTIKEWLMYYKNIWTRNLVSFSVDVNNDQFDKKRDPNMLVDYVTDGQKVQITVKERLELRKIDLKDSRDVLDGIERLLALYKDDESFKAEFWSDEALKVDEDMIEPTETVEVQSTPVTPPKSEEEKAAEAAQGEATETTGTEEAKPEAEEAKPEEEKVEGAEESKQE